MRDCHDKALCNPATLLIFIKENMAINLWLAEHELKCFQVCLILDVDINGLLALVTVLQTVVFFDKLSDHSSVAAAAFNTDVRVPPWVCSGSCQLKGSF